MQVPDILLRFVIENSLVGPEGSSYREDQKVSPAHSRDAGTCSLLRVRLTRELEMFTNREFACGPRIPKPRF